MPDAEKIPLGASAYNYHVTHPLHGEMVLVYVGGDEAALIPEPDGSSRPGRPE